jgi:hypothetical protein
MQCEGIRVGLVIIVHDRNERIRIRISSRGSWYGRAGERKGFAQKLSGLLQSFSAAILTALQRIIWFQGPEPGMEVDDLDDLTSLIGDPHNEDLIKIYARPLQYFTSFSRNGCSNSEALPLQMAGMTIPTRDFEDILHIEAIEG